MVTSPDGSQMWVSNRYGGGVSVIDTRTGAVLATIATGDQPHGLTYWPQPGIMSVGQNGNMR
jgi:YVTN family beta-propeller protein